MDHPDFERHASVCVCVLEFKDNWVKHLFLVEFAYNNNYQANISMASYEALYRRKCRTPIY